MDIESVCGIIVEVVGSHWAWLMDDGWESRKDWSWWRIRMASQVWSCSISGETKCMYFGFIRKLPSFSGCEAPIQLDSTFTEYNWSLPLKETVVPVNVCGVLIVFSNCFRIRSLFLSTVEPFEDRLMCSDNEWMELEFGGDLNETTSLETRRPPSMSYCLVVAGSTCPTWVNAWARAKANCDTLVVLK